MRESEADRGHHLTKRYQSLIARSPASPPSAATANAKFDHSLPFGTMGHLSLGICDSRIAFISPAIRGEGPNRKSLPFSRGLKNRASGRAVFQTAAKRGRSLLVPPSASP